MKRSRPSLAAGTELWVTFEFGASEGVAHLTRNHAERERRRQAAQFVHVRVLRVRVQRGNLNTFERVKP